MKSESNIGSIIFKGVHITFVKYKSKIFFEKLNLLADIKLGGIKFKAVHIVTLVTCML